MLFRVNSSEFIEWVRIVFDFEIMKVYKFLSHACYKATENNKTLRWPPLLHDVSYG